MALDARQQAFIDRMMPMAMEASRATGLDPRLIIAQAAQETGWGKSAPGYNYFGIKGHGAANAQPLGTFEYREGQKVAETAPFRYYGSPEESVKDYVHFLKTNPRYGAMLGAEGLDDQVAALGASGYATDPNYARSVGQIARSIPTNGDRYAQEGGIEVTDPELLRMLEGEGGTEVTDPDLIRLLEGEETSGGRINTAIREEMAAGGPPAAERASPPSTLEAFNRAGTAMVADINAGFQGVNPVAVSQASPVGAVVRKGGKVYSDIDGSLTEITPEEFPNYITQVDPDTGTEWLYKRTPELEDPGAASAGRVLGYGIIGGPGQAVRAASKAESAASPAMRTMQERGITPSLGMTGGGGARVAGALEGNVVTSGPIVRDAQRAYGEVQTALGETAASVGPGTTAFEGGQALRDGANKFLVEHLKGSPNAASRSQMLFDRVDQAIPKGTMIDVGDLTGTLGKFVEKFQNAPNIGQSLGAGRWQKWLDDIAANGGKLTWGQARALRTDIGEAIGKLSGPISDVSGGELKLLYGALTRDLDAAAAAVGPGALKAWKNANEHYKWASEKIQEAFDIMFRGDPHNEKVYANFLAMGAEGGPRANAAKLADIKRVLPEEDWATVVATTIRRMGQATPGGQDAAGEVFSAGKFMTDWNKLSPAAKTILFSGKGVPHGLRAELDAMARVVELAKNAEKQINYSRSGSTLGNLGVGALGGASIALGSTTTALVSAVVANLGARAITNPTFLRAARDYAARGGTPELARKLIQAAGDDRELLANAATITRLAAPQSSQQPQLPQAPGRLGLPAP